MFSLSLIDACNWLAHGSFWHGRLDLPRPKPAQSWRRNCFRASCSVLAFMSMPKVKISPLYATVALKLHIAREYIPVLIMIMYMVL